jgi:O-antigen/teichoic acid export membrane protein
MSKFKSFYKKNEFLSFSGNLAYAALSFLSFLILTRSFEKVVFGEWVLFITSSMFIEMFRFGLTRTAIVRFLSGANEREKKELIGSNWILSLMVTVFFSILIIVAHFIFKEAINNSGFHLFFKWYPVYAFVALPFNNALTVLQAKLKFGKILILRLSHIVLFDIFLILNLFILKLDILQVLYVFLACNLTASLISLATGWDGIKFIFNFNISTLKKVFHFGKYSIGTLIGSNILKSADTFILGFSPVIGVEGVALYSIPIKLTEIMEIPLRSMAATSFPKMSKASLNNNLNQVREVFYKYTGAVTFFFIPFAIFNFIFAEFFVTLVGGETYIETANIYRVFCLYGLILPLDRFTGVALDAINLPKFNLVKVLFMVVTNIIGDLIAIFYFESIIGVAIVTVIMTTIGIFIGNYFLRKEMNFSYRMLLSKGLNFYIDLLNKLRNRKTAI